MVKIWRIFTKIIMFLSKMSTWTSVFCLFALTGMIFVAVFARYLFNAPILGIDEISGYLNVFIGFLALAYTLHEGRHVRVDVVTNRLSQKARDILELITIPLALILIGQFIRTGWYSWKILVATEERAQTYLLTPLAIPYGVMLFCWVLFFFAILIQYANFINNRFILKKETSSTEKKVTDKTIL